MENYCDPLAVPKVSAADVEEAAQNLAELVRRTPVEISERLTRITGVPVYLKREDQQLCRSFKVRGAYHRMSQLSPEERELGVVCASAGNHAQGVANACRRLGIRGTIYLPLSTPRQKRDRIRTIGGDWVDLQYVDGAFDDAQHVAIADSERTKLIYIHPYDDPAVIAGQGSVAIELAEQLGDEVRNVLIPVGGGGLLGGMSAWLKAMRPDIRIIGVESAGAASTQAALKAGGPKTLREIDSFVDGTAVSRVGDCTYSLISSLVDDIVVVDEGAVSTEMLDLYHADGIIAEPAGALASAALVAAAEGRIADLDLEGSTAVIVSGGNNDLSRYSEVMERSQHYQGVRHYFLVAFPQQPGALRHFLADVLGSEDDIVHFEYTKKTNRHTGPALVGIDINQPQDLPALLDRMEESPLSIERIPTDSDLLRFLI